MRQSTINRNGTRTTITTIITSLCLVAATFAAFGATFNLFEDDGATQAAMRPESSLRSANATMRKARPVTMNQRLINGSGGIRPGDELNVELFNGDVATVKARAAYVNVNDTFVLSGSLVNAPDRHFHLVCDEGAVLSSIDESPDGDAYSIRRVGARHYLFQDDPDRYDVLGCGGERIHQRLTSILAGEAAKDDTNSYTIDVMILYTPNAATWASTNANGPIDNIIAMAVAKCNTTHANSETQITFNLVHSQEVSYTEHPNNMDTDLNNLTNGDNGLSTAHTLRDSHAADVVTLFTKADDSGGLGWIYNGSDDYGYNIVRVQQAAWTYTYAHEVGHNQGCGHHEDQGPGEKGIYSYSSAHRWIGSDSVHYRSIMAYAKSFSGVDDTEVGYLSNPDVTHLGAATGSSTQDHALTVRMTKSTVASFRSGAATTYSLTVNNGSGDGSYAGGDTVNISADAAPAGQVFTQWTGDTSYVSDVSASSTFVTMPSQDVTVTATYTVAATRVLTVNNGSGGGNYTSGQVATIVADAPPSEQVFDQWTGDTSHLADVSASTTTVTMPNKDITVNATYVNDPTLYVNVTFEASPGGGGSTNPSGVQSLKKDALTNISATVNSGYSFSKWSATAGIGVTNPENPSTTMTAAQKGTVTAIFVLEVDFPQARVNLDSSRDDRGQATLKNVELPFNDFDPDTQEAVVTIDDYTLYCTDANGEWKTRGHKPNHKAQFNSNKDYNQGRVKLTFDFRKSEWNLKVSKATLNSSVDHNDGVTFLLKIDDDVYGDTLGMSERTRWKFRGDENAWEVDDVPGSQSFTTFNLNDAKGSGKIDSTKVLGDRLNLKKINYALPGFDASDVEIQVGGLTFDVPPLDVKRNGFQYKGTLADGELQLKFDTRKNQLDIKVKDCEFTAIDDALTLVVKVGDYAVIAELELDRKTRLDL